MDLKFLKKAADSDAFTAVAILVLLAIGTVIVYYPTTLFLALVASACYGIYQAGKSSR